MRKHDFCICKNKCADQLHGHRVADQCLCFCYKDYTIPVLPKSEISSILPSSVVVQLGSCYTWSETPRQVLLVHGSFENVFIIESHHEKTNVLVSDLLRHNLYSYRRWLEICDFRFRK